MKSCGGREQIDHVWLVARKPMGDSQKVVWAEFSTLSLAVFVVNEIAWHTQARSSLELKTQPKFCPVSVSLSG